MDNHINDNLNNIPKPGRENECCGVCTRDENGNWLINGELIVSIIKRCPKCGRYLTIDFSPLKGEYIEDNG
jgi:hypothetical protein